MTRSTEDRIVPFHGQAGRQQQYVACSQLGGLLAPDVEELLALVTPEQPSGPLMEYTPAFTALFEMARGKPEQRMGESVIPAEPPDWGKVEQSALALLAQTRDLRVASLLVKAKLHRAGAAGLFEGIALVRALLERHWNTIHPQLDPEDGDPTMRVNALADLADFESMLAEFRNTELAIARGVGRICVRDLERSASRGGATGAGEQDGGEKAATADAVLSAWDPVRAAKIAEGAEAAAGDVSAIEAFVRERVGEGHGPDLSRLAALLHMVAKALSARNTGETPGNGAAHVAESGAPPTDGRAMPGDGPRPAGEINSRRDVLLALDAVCAYYERCEPSSPVPLLLRRSKRLVHMSFIDIVRDLVPDAAPTVEALRGKEG